ncbi:hypothetical protein SAMN06295905_1862 [Devosia lucknowensis]|uniref:Uncharacterized protein n=1 Tax=Devosia lucknowensis TaxID=1096929 RepID=A0A1Y6F794_9HYPH|nr:hypothetical protein [Devosia lucknowensis]SMQ70276.1 hypothetical protein SAMN06295905_1862 [Devosia lucknowensis]
MSAAPNALLLIAFAILATAFVVALLGFLGRRARPAVAPAGVSATLSDRFEAANSRLAEVISKENNALLAVTTLPEDVGPMEAEAALRAATPDWSMHDRQVLMLQAWEVQRRPQALAALAGLPLANPDKSFAMLNGTLVRALRDGEPALLGQIAEAIDARFDALGALADAGGIVVTMERAAERIRLQAPEVATVLEATMERMWPRTRRQMLAVLRIRIDEWDDERPVDPRGMAEDLAQYSWPRLPELMAEVHEALDKRNGPEWERAQLWYDKAVLQRYCDVEDALKGFDIGAVVERLAKALMSPDAETSRFAAETAADLIGDYFIENPRHFATLKTALTWAGRTHELTPSHEWLAQSLDPTDAGEDVTLDAERYGQIRAGIERFIDTTATTDPLVARAELRAILPDAPIDILRVALIARWKDSRDEVLLVALAGLSIEALEDGEDGRMAQLCLHWPLKAGSADLVLSITAELDERSERLDPWLRTEDGVRDLLRATGRVSAAGRGLDRAARDFLDWAEARHVVLLTEMVAARLERDSGDDDGALQLALDLYRMVLPDEPALLWPVQKYMRERAAAPAWREALLHFESMRANHFAALGEADAAELAELVDLFCEALRDSPSDVARLAAYQAAQLVTLGVIARPEHLAKLDERLTWAGNLHGMVPDSFVTLRAALSAASPKGEDLVRDRPR